MNSFLSVLDTKDNRGKKKLYIYYITFCYNNTIRSAVTIFRTVKYNENKTNQNESYFHMIRQLWFKPWHVLYIL